MNQVRYDAAKDVLLDLLGWGVDPAYLVECGLSRELIYYVFTELNLRLPDNLDTTGLLPYNPLTAKNFNFTVPGPSLRDRIKDLPVLSTSTLPSTPSTDESPKPIPPTVPALEVNLNDIEKRRRQELIARKAVQASRKAKKSTPPAPPPETVPSATVDDFLNTITSFSPATSSNHNSTAMDVDEPTAIRVVTDLPTLSNSGSSSPAAASTSTTTPRDVPPSSTDSMMTTFDTLMRLSPETSSGNITPVHHISTRRGMKRPVASDFVDLDTDTSSRPVTRSNTLDGAPNGSNTSVRRKTGGKTFVNIVQPKKCVIDVSDSEEEEEVSRAPSSALKATTSRHIPTRPPVSSRGASTPGITPSASTLHETETAIQRLRKEIAQAEQKRLLKKKLGVSHEPSMPLFA